MKVREKDCTGCGACVRDCVLGSIQLVQGKAALAGPCLRCGHCVAVCPQGAVELPVYGMDGVEAYEKETFTLNPDHVLHAVKFRRSIRDFQERPVEQEKLVRILEAGRYTETAVNRQGVRFILVQEKLSEAKELIWEGWKRFCEEFSETDPILAASFLEHYEKHQENPKNDRLFFNAPVLAVLACENPLDGGLAAANMEMMAVAEGLGVLFDGYVAKAIGKSREAQEWLGLDGKPVAACMLLGYPNVQYHRTAPRRAADVVWR